jgi:NDP-sugar pyrophosphorylase family protein
MSDSGIKAVILAGGKGTRLRPYTAALPKPLMPVGELPILEIIIRQLKNCGITRLTLSVGHLHGLLQAFFGDGGRWGADIDYSLEAEPLGTAGPVALVEELTDPFLVLNGDLLCSLDFADMIAQHKASGAAATIATYTKEVKLQLGVLSLSDGQVVDYIEKPSLRHHVSMGIYVFNREILPLLPKGERLDLPDLIKRMIAADKRVNAYRFDGYWRDIGTVEEYLTANEEIETILPELHMAPVGPASV